MLSVIYCAVLAFVNKIFFFKQLTHYIVRNIAIFIFINYFDLNVMLVSHSDAFCCIPMQEAAYLLLVYIYLSTTMANEVNGKHICIIELVFDLMYLAWTSNNHNAVLAVYVLA